MSRDFKVALDLVLTFMNFYVYDASEISDVLLLEAVMYKAVLVLALYLGFVPVLYADVSGDYYTVSVLGARIKPLKASGRCWDFRCSSRRTRALREVEGKVKELVLKYGVKQLQKLAKLKGLTTLSSMDPTGIALALTAASFGMKMYASGKVMPDPYLRLDFSGGYTIKTHVLKDTLIPDWGTNGNVFIRPGDGVKIRLRDKDFSNDDPIGYKYLKIPLWVLQRAQKYKGVLWKIRGFSQVYGVDLVIRRAGASRVTSVSPGLYRVTLVKANITSHKRNGKGWDFARGAPDPFMRLFIGRNGISTHVSKNTYSPAWNVSQAIRIYGREKVNFYLYDKDFRQNDLIAACSTTLSQMKLLNGRLYVVSCGQASQITIRFDRIR